MKKMRLVILVLLMIFFSLMAIYSLFNIYLWWKDNNKTRDQIKIIYELLNIDPTTEENTKYLDINFEELEKSNDEVVAWVQVLGTNINYPVVKHSDNSFYLTHSFDKSYNNAGWPFLDANNNIDNLEYNTVVYAHGRVDKTMFGSLRDVLTDEWLSNEDNYIVRVSTKNYNYLYQVFSTYHIATTTDYVKKSFSTAEEYLEFLDLIKSRSTNNFNVELDSNDRILTLSTCYSNWEKMVLHAKLIERQKRT